MGRTFHALVGLLLVVPAVGCEGSGLLGPDAEQGIAVLALRGPICPVADDGQACDDQPHQAWIDIRDGDGRRVIRIRTDEEGRFRVGLVAGQYRLVPESGDPFPVASPRDVEVSPGAFTEVTVSFDTGIR
jgi:hypothetical protein